MKVPSRAGLQAIRLYFELISLVLRLVTSHPSGAGFKSQLGYEIVMADEIQRTNIIYRRSRPYYNVLGSVRDVEAYTLVYACKMHP